jgi:NTE family protein
VGAVSATPVTNVRGHVFKNNTITPDVLLASACLPTMFQAIEIDGEPYWDGGYSGNPTITPLIRECKSQDTILVQINPVEREGCPRSASEILNRLNEVSFNAVLLKELRMIAMLRQVANPGNSEGAQWAGMRIHRVASEMLTELGASSKLNAEWEFFSLLHDEGRRSAQVFWRSMHWISGVAPPWISTPCCKVSDAQDFSADLAVYRCWSVLLLAQLLRS